MVARVSNLMLAERMLRNIQKDLSDLAKTHEQFSSGRIFSKPSENPFGFMTSLRVREMLTAQHRYAATIEGGISNLEFSESLLSSVNGIIQRSQEMAILASNSPMSDTAASSLAEELRQLLDEVMSLANSQNGGRYVFAGTRTDKKPFEFGVDNLGQQYVVYRGNIQEHRVQVDQGILVTDNMNGLETFFASIGTIRSAALVSDPTATLVTALPNAPVPSNGDFSGTFLVNGATITVTATDTLETLRDKINHANVDVVASIDPLNRLVVQSYRSTQVHLEEGTSNVLQALGLLGTVEGTMIGAGLTDATSLGAIGLANLEGIRLEQGDQTLDVDLSSAATLGDVLTLINSSGLNVNAYINANQTGINIASLDTSKELKISDTRRIFGSSFGIGIDDNMPLFALGVTPGVIEIQNDDLIFQVDLSTANTIGDILAAINSAPGNGGVRAVINANGTGIDILSPYQSGSLEVREVGGGTMAFDLGILDIQNKNSATSLGLVGEGKLDETKPESLFQTMLELETMIRSGNQESNIMSKHSELQRELDAMLSVRARSGTRVSNMQNLRNNYLDREVFLTDMLSKNEDADLAALVVQLQTQQTSIEAAMQSGATVLQNSLLNFLR